METGNVDVVLMRITANECKTAAEDLARYLDTGLPATESCCPPESYWRHFSMT
jgi:hypothetical protein